MLTLNFAAGLTHVGVVADALVYHESESSTANLTLTRDGDLSTVIIVNYSEKINVDGSARTVTGTKKFKAGKSTAKVKIGTGGSYGKAAIKFRITAGTGYVVGSPAKAKVTVFGD